MVSWALLLRAEIRRRAALVIRYPIEFLSELLLLYLLFIGVFFVGARVIVGANSAYWGATFKGTIVGYLVWFLAAFAIDSMSKGLQTEVQTGTLEQLCQSPHSLTSILLCRLIVGTGLQVLIIAIVGLAITLSTHVQIAVSWPIVGLWMLTNIGLWGVGFALGGLTLLFKRIGQFPLVLQIIFLGLATVPFSETPGASQDMLVRLLPLVQGMRLIRAALDRPIAAQDGPGLIVLAANSAIYLFVGIGLFLAAEQITRKRGMLGHY